MDFRHEWKHEIGKSDLYTIRARLMSVMARDVHTIDGRYEIRSPYFDNLEVRVLREKIDCVKYRE